MSVSHSHRWPLGHLLGLTQQNMRLSGHTVQIVQFFSKKRQAFMLHYWLIVFAANLLGTAGRCLNSELLYLLPCLCHHLYLSLIITATHFITPSCPVSYP
jgi:hypothetical protein